MRIECRNRNRQTKLEPKPSDRDMTLLRLDDRTGKPIVTIVNFTTHPTSIPAETLKFSADYVGALRDAVRRETGGWDPPSRTVWACERSYLR